MTDREKKEYIDKHLTKIYPQLKVNMGKICGAATDKWADDLLSIALEFFLNKDIDIQYDSCKSGKAENFITYMANFQVKSGYSKFFHTHRKFVGRTREYFTDHFQYDAEKQDEHEDDDAMLCIKSAIKNLDPFEKMLVEERILKGLRFKEISDNYNITYQTLKTTLNKTLKEIEHKCKHLRSSR